VLWRLLAAPATRQAIAADILKGQVRGRTVIDLDAQ